MNGQPYPTTKIFVGAELYSAEIYTDENGKTTCDIDTWVVRSIRRRAGSQTKNGRKNMFAESDVNQRKFVHFTMKQKDVTWTRQSRKVNDYGWSKTIDPFFRKSCVAGGRLPFGIYTTRTAALRFAISCVNEEIAELHTTDSGDFEAELAVLEKELKVLQRRLTSEKKRKRGRE